MGKVKESLEATFNGISQVNFLQKPWFGFLVFLGFFFLNIYSAIAVLISSFISYLVAKVLYDREFAVSGLAAFNSVLLILAIYVFLGGFTSLFYVIPVTLFGMLVFHICKILFEKVDLVAFSLPFVLSTYVLILVDKIWPGVFFTDKYLYKIASLFDTLDFSIGNHFLFTSGDTFFQASLAFSLLLLVCYFIFEKEYIIYILSSYFFSLFIFFVIGQFFTVEITSFTTFNIVLTMMALKAFGLLPRNKMLIVKLFLISLAIILVKLAFDYLMGLIGLPSIVLPFILVTDTILAYQNIKKRSNSVEGTHVV